MNERRRCREHSLGQPIKSRGGNTNEQEAAAAWACEAHRRTTRILAPWLPAQRIGCLWARAHVWQAWLWCGFVVLMCSDVLEQDFGTQGAW
jgi:hypothetical protein